MTEERVREAMIGALRRIAPEVDPRQLDPGRTSASRPISTPWTSSTSWSLSARS
jgi:hypothetical protein